MNPPHILVVCTANICRSPVGEALLQAKVQAEGLPNWTISSAGTRAKIGEAASPFSRILMSEQGLDISCHSSLLITELLLQQSDLILCMETRHVKTLRSTFPAFEKKLFTLKQMVDKRGSVRDPYGGSRRDYERMVAEVYKLIEKGFPRIKQLAERNHQSTME
ncbi:MAG: low molecular weight protein arginine phosphatase [Chloroflexi bacterium]|nr:low molecular weight protein arginine phosphatase [Chloroflexota bacterium]